MEPYVGPVVDLLNPYTYTRPAHHTGEDKKAGAEYVRWWLETHPGRWALVGEDEWGLSRHEVENMGFRPGLRRQPGTPARTYAQNPHPLAEDLVAALRRSYRPPVLDLPELTKSSFNWTPEELADACRAARKILRS